MTHRNLSLYIALSLMAAPELASAAQGAPYGHKTVFRYRCFEGSVPSWVSPLDLSVGNVNHSAGSSDIAVIERGDGFDRMLTADLNGQNEFIRASSSIDTIDDAGTDSFTIQAWFLAHQTDGYRALVSNTQSYTGFSLKLHDGQLRGLVRFAHGSGYQNIEILGGAVPPHVWTYAALRVKRLSGSYELRLFQDGNEVASLNTGSNWDGVRQSAEHPMVGAEPSAGVGVDSFFDGRIYAVSITNYAVGVDSFLENEGVRDASRYFGMVSYHDYLDPTRGPDHRIADTIAKYSAVNGTHDPLDPHVSTRFYSPFMNDLYVPQGVASNGVDRLYLSMYWKDKEGNHCGEHDSSVTVPPSIVVEVTTAGELVRVIQLLDENWEVYCGHVGGAAYWGGFLYLPRGEDVLRYDLSGASGPAFVPGTFANTAFDQDPIAPDYVAYDCDFVSSSNEDIANTGISYLSISEDHDGTPVLWTGQFGNDNSNYPPPGREIVGFVLSCDGTFDPDNPDHVYTLPVDDVQGLYAYYATCGELRFYLSCSFGDHPSTLFDAHYDRGVHLATNANLVFTGPAGMEDLTRVGDDFWTISESGAKYFQKRDSSPWDQLFPFVFAIDNLQTPTPSTCSGTPFCLGDATGSYCPCGNFGTPGGGCANDTGTGARLSASGSNSVSADDLALAATCLTPGPGLYFQGNNAINGGEGNPFGDGLRCAGSQVVRLEVQFSSAGSSSTTISIAAKGGVSVGDTRRYQYWYRDTGGSPCGSGFNLSNGYEITWTP